MILVDFFGEVVDGVFVRDISYHDGCSGIVADVLDLNSEHV